MAIEGNGFFVVQGANGQLSYTRAGDFTTNSAGQLVTPQGQLVLGYPTVNGVTQTGGTLGPISVNQQGTIPGSPTTTFNTTTNLDSSAAVGATFSTPVTVYDSQGTPQTLTTQYTKTGTNTWSYSTTIPASATGGTTPTVVSSGTMTFDASGNLTSPTGTIPGISITGLADGAAPLNLTWNLAGTGGNSSITQLNSTSATSAVSQDGYGVGSMTGYAVAPDGTVEGEFSNNQTRALGQVALASFGNPQGLIQAGSGDYIPTTASGAAVIGAAEAGGNGAIEGSAVESSNVDMTTEFANMIVAQQGYQANAKALTTFDQVSQATLQLIS
jgi:flagellar hook protein FlgE